MRWFALVWVGLVISGSGVATASPSDPAAWGEHLKIRYKHAKAIKISSKPTLLHLGLCGRTPALQPRPGFTRIDLDFADENLFQDAWIEIAQLEAGVDVIDIVARAKNCHANKRYQVAIQAGDTLVLYHARCSQMRTPFDYDVADLIAAIEDSGATIGERLIANPCGSFEHNVTTLETAKDAATKRRKLYKHRFPASREAFKHKAP